MGDPVVKSTGGKTNTEAISHSIIRSLNLFNSITKDDTKKINSKLLDMNSWFQDINNKINITKDKRMLLSPEHTKSISKDLKQENGQEQNYSNSDMPRLSSPRQIRSLHFDNNTDSIVLDSETTGKQEFITANPSPIMQRTPKNTETVTVSIDNALESNIPKPHINDISIHDKTVEEDKPSPWSPFKVENTLKNANVSMDEHHETVLSNHSISISQPHITVSNNIKPKEDTGTIKAVSILEESMNQSIPNLKAPPQKIITDTTFEKESQNDSKKQALKTLITSPNNPINKPALSNSPIKPTKLLSNETIKPNIRVNMFAPLPEKDPLIVRNSSPQSLISRSNNNTLKFQNIASTSNVANTNHNNVISTSKQTLSNSNNSPSSGNSNRITATPGNKTNLRTNLYTNSERRNRLSPQKSSKTASPLIRRNESNVAKNIHTRNSKSPVSKLVSKTPSRTSSNTIKSVGVFDRLSSIPTKSFEQKIRQRTGTTPMAPRRHNPSSIDITGSPLKRMSPQHKTANQSEILEQEALSSIFFKNKTQEIRSPLRKERVPPRHKQALAPSEGKSNQVYDSLIPKLDHSTNGKEVPDKPTTSIQSNKLTKQINKIESPNKPENITGRSIDSHGTNTLVELSKMSPSQNSFNISPTLQETTTTPATIEKNKIVSATHISLSSLNPNERVSPKNINHIQFDTTQKMASSNKSVGTETRDEQETVSAKDSQLKNATTKIKLIPSIENGKDDVKTKLNKRLSQVIRTQQEQEKKRKENQQKRKKSQLEDELKKKKGRYSNYKMYSKKRSLGTNPDHLSKSGYFNANGLKSNMTNTKQTNDPIMDTSNILGDIDKVDYRNVVGGDYSPEMNETARPPDSNQVGDDSLPEIPSDDELEHDVLADWAQSHALEKQLRIQQSWDPKQIFGPIAPLHIEEIFPNSSTSRLSKVKTKFNRKSTWNS
ncbi:inner centromere protein-related protein Sli15p [Monosporozyma servazzii]